MPSHSSKNPWRYALGLAAATPAKRKREIDFLRAIAILAVVFGHWLVAGSTLVEGRLLHDHALHFSPWTKGLTWVFQIMPIFFFVGGFSNLTSWQAARRDQKPFSVWLQSRLARLASPLVPLLFVWALIAVIAHALQLEDGMIGTASQLALVPIWFLAIYALIILTAPATIALWNRWGWLSIFCHFGVAIALDLLFFSGIEAPSWFNYFFIWSGVHMLGYAWKEQKAPSAAQGVIVASCGFVGLCLIVFFGPYPVSMVGVPGELVSNTLPPKLPMVLLAWIQFGVVLAIEKRLARLLEHQKLWATVILLNSHIMTIFLWHMTAWILWTWLAAHLFGGFGVTMPLGSDTWWMFRPLWMLCLALTLLPFLLLFGRFERPARNTPVLQKGLLILATLALIWGISWIALKGVEGSWFGVRPDAVLPPLISACWLTGWFRRKPA